MAPARAAPRRTFAFAIGQTAEGGEIGLLDPAGYGAVTIANAISIVNVGVGVAAIGVASGNAITINARPSDTVHLRGLTIEGLGSGAIVRLSSAPNGIHIAMTATARVLMLRQDSDAEFFLPQCR
ncbi:MAG: hypothetical protein ACREDD_01875 [Methylocella sp.]